MPTHRRSLVDFETCRNWFVMLCTESRSNGARCYNYRLVLRWVKENQFWVSMLLICIGWPWMDLVLGFVAAG